MDPKIINAHWLYAFTAVIITIAIVQSLIFMKRAWSRALSLGLANKDIKKGLMTGITISIMPTLPVLIVFLSLVPLLGSPIPWLRLSVIGSAHYETYAASTALQSLGQELVPGKIAIDGWIAAAWVMTVGGSACILWSSLALKPISLMYEKAEDMFDMGMVLALGTGCLVGVMAYVSVAYGLSAVPTKGVVFGASFLCGAVLVFILHKIPSAKWISDYLMAISMVASMIVACIVF